MIGDLEAGIRRTKHFSGLKFICHIFSQAVVLRWCYTRHSHPYLSCIFISPVPKNVALSERLSFKDMEKSYTNCCRVCFWCEAISASSLATCCYLSSHMTPFWAVMWGATSQLNLRLRAVVFCSTARNCRQPAGDRRLSCEAALTTTHRWQRGWDCLTNSIGIQNWLRKVQYYNNSDTIYLSKKVW